MRRCKGTESSVQEPLSSIRCRHNPERLLVVTRNASTSRYYSGGDEGYPAVAYLAFERFFDGFKILPVYKGVRRYPFYLFQRAQNLAIDPLLRTKS